MNVSTSVLLLKYGGIALTVLGVLATILIGVVNSRGLVRARWLAYVRTLDRELRFLMIRTPAARVAGIQLGAIGILMIAAFFARNALFAAVALVVAVLPYLWLRSKHGERVRKLEESLDTWLLMLSNALKASPSLGEAFQASAKLIRAPFSEELDLVLKEMKLGTPLDQAVLNMSSRIDSRVISTSLATVLVGRQTGGDLPAILEQSASTLREMARLEGVVRTKTAEGKAQLWVLALMPFLLFFALHQVDPNWLTPLLEDEIGWIVLVVATVIWASALLLARKILTVDI